MSSLFKLQECLLLTIKNTKKIFGGKEMRTTVVFLCSLIGFNLTAENPDLPANTTSMVLQESQLYQMRLKGYNDNQRFEATIATNDWDTLSYFDQCKKTDKDYWEVNCEKDGESLAIFFEQHYIAVWTEGENMQILDAAPQDNWTELDFTQSTIHEMKIEKNSINGNDIYKVTLNGLDFMIEEFTDCTVRYENREDQCQDFYLECHNDGEKPSQVKLKATAEAGCKNYFTSAEWISPANVLGPVYFAANECTICKNNNAAATFKRAVRAFIQGAVNAAIRTLGH